MGDFRVKLAGVTAEVTLLLPSVDEMRFFSSGELEVVTPMLGEERVARTHILGYVERAYSENKAIRRKSEALMSSSANDKRVVRLQNDLEALSKDLEIEKIEHKKDVNKLNQQLHDLQHSSQQLAKINELEEKLLAAVTEAELMRNRADTLERRTLAAESYCDKLKQENDRLQAAKGPTDIPDPPPASAIPPPPPPPPPGPPPPPLPTFRPISEIVQKNKKKKKTAEAPKDPRVDAMAEMMARIKSGQVLLKHSDPQKKPGDAEKSAMNQLATTLKLRKSLGGAARRPSEKAASSVTDELAMKLKRRQQRAGEDQTDNGTGEDIFVTPPASPVPRDRSLSYSPSPSPLRLNSEDPTTQDQKDRPYSFSPGTFPIRFTTDNPTSQGSRDDETLYEEINVTAVKQTASEVDNVYYETTVDLVEKGRSTDGSDVKTEAIEEQIYSVPDDPEQSDVAHDPTGGD
ncbi:shootin-1-like [Corticium candelabrum]|uniref:shootin-1-like n=1 Tax=Corticium candelabrum TaxID=121492 RepID=UPI002E26374B|nr:shootin-1-like [Corticium candelabrum]